MSLLWLLLFFPAWTLGWWAWYLIFEAKRDASGDGGIAMFFIGLIWLWPVYNIGLFLLSLFKRKS